MANDKANWQNVNTETLPTEIKVAYESYKLVYRTMKEERDEFERLLRTALADHTPKGKRIAIAYNFGKLSVAVVDDDKPKATPAKALSLADLIRR